MDEVKKRGKCTVKWDGEHHKHECKFEMNHEGLCQCRFCGEWCC